MGYSPLVPARPPCMLRRVWITRRHELRTNGRVWAGAVWMAASVIGSASAQLYPANIVELLSNIPLAGFTGAPGNGNDCWGLTSPSGREYALMGRSNSVALVEITNPRGRGSSRRSRIPTACGPGSRRIAGTRTS